MTTAVRTIEINGVLVDLNENAEADVERILGVTVEDLVAMTDVDIKSLVERIWP